MIMMIPFFFKDPGDHDDPFFFKDPDDYDDPFFSWSLVIMIIFMFGRNNRVFLAARKLFLINKLVQIRF